MACSPRGPLSPSRASLARAVDDGGVVAGEVVLGEQLAHFHFDQFQQFGVVHHVALVQEHDDVGHAHLAGQQDVLAGLGHGAVSGRAHQDGAVHLGGAGDHVLHVVGVAGAVHVGVVAAGRFVFDVGGVDGDAAGLFFRRRVDLVVRLGFAAELGRQHGRDGRRQRRLAMVHVTNRAHVHVRLGTFKFSFCHFSDSEKRYLNQQITAHNQFGRTMKDWCPWRESDPRPLPYQGSALPLSHKGENLSPCALPDCGAGDGNRTRVISLEG
jgi:hypothetical protein